LPVYVPHGLAVLDNTYSSLRTDDEREDFIATHPGFRPA
jgi:hypothetical protein